MRGTTEFHIVALPGAPYGAPVGHIGTVASERTVPCDGRWLAKGAYPLLYAALRTPAPRGRWRRLLRQRALLRAAYGDAEHHFRVPDLRGYLAADGRALARADYPGIYAALRSERRDTRPPG